MDIILASGSPRRRELLELAGYPFAVEVSEADEKIGAEAPGEMVEELAERKALAVANHHRKEPEERLVIGADTIVVLNGAVLGKPADAAEAKRMLRSLSGREHQVYTGVALISVQKGTLTVRRFHECTKVRMRTMTEEEIDAYVATGDPLDKAGAYGIQGPAAIFISGICGDYYNVVGLPICRLSEELAKVGKNRG